MLRLEHFVRIGLSCFFILWLSVQFVVLGVSPRWGFVLPHEHILRGVVTASEWQEHMREHELGLASGRLFKERCGDQGTTDTSPITASIPNFQGSFSLFSAMSATVQPLRTALPSLVELSVRSDTRAFVVIELFYPPPKPPPNFIPA